MIKVLFSLILIYIAPLNSTFERTQNKNIKVSRITHTFQFNSKHNPRITFLFVKSETQKYNDGTNVSYFRSRILQ